MVYTLLSKMLSEKDNTNLLPESEEERAVKRLGFNGLTPTQWAQVSKNVWNDLSSPRNSHQLEHGAVFPIKLAERLIQMYSAEGDSVLDPFLGIGTTLIAAQNLKRHGIGTELNPRFAKIAETWLEENRNLFSKEFCYKIVNDDCRNLLNHVRPEKIQVTVTSLPYADFIRKSVEDRKTVHKKSVIKHENNSTVKAYSDDSRDFGSLPYKDFLEEIKIVLKANFTVTKNGGYSAWIVKDYRDTKNKVPYVPFHSDLARAGEEVGFKFHDLIVWDQTGQRRLILLGYPTVFYTNQNSKFN
ncbi:MAG: site-specific DNA-methyltransferase [Acidobacteriota bacterium]|nr:site-specific DNA-methyltransferase [Acidobacteriota bacterium]